MAAHRITAITQSTGSRLFVERASLNAAMAMIASTAGPTPRNNACTHARPWYCA